MAETTPGVTDDAAEQATRDELLKLLLDEERLAILGFVARGACTGDELAAALPIKRATMARQIAQLVTAGLLRVEDERIHVDVAHIRRLKQTLFARPIAPKPEGGDAQVLATFVRDGKVPQLPAQPAKRLVVLTWLAERFEPGRAYRETEVNDLLRGHGDDHVTLRRYLVDAGLLTRADGLYRRGIPTGETQT